MPPCRIAQEALEYYILANLSTYLVDYFNRSETADESRIKVLERDDIPDVLLKNRFIELFSRPMEQREAFLSHKNDPSPGKVVAAYGAGGEIFADSDFNLPAEMKISRKADGSISLSSWKLSFTIKCDFSAINTIVPHQFCSLYLNRSWDSVETTKYNIILETKIKWFSAILPNGWQYYAWLDGFKDRMAKEVDFEYFLAKIGWEYSLTNRIIQVGMLDEERYKREHTRQS